MIRQLFDRAIPEHFGYRNWAYLAVDEIDFPGTIGFKNDINKPCYKILENNGQRRIESSYFVGIDWLQKNELFIQVEPKLNSSDTFTDYLGMLSIAMKHPLTSDFVSDIYEIKLNAEPIPINQQDDLITPLLIIQYINLLKKIVKKGLIKSYHQQESNLKSRIKGKILVGPNIKENLLKNKPLYTKCKLEIFDEDVVLNRVLKKGLSFAKRYMNTYALSIDREKLSYITPAFERVSNEVSIGELKGLKINSFFKEYNEALSIAKLIMSRFGYNINSIEKGKKIKTPPFWIDMSLLFELYTLGLLKDEFENVEFQFHGHYGYPDFLIKARKMVVDAKYKPVYQENSVDIENIRQISGYARDNKVRDFLDVSPNEELECLIIYPDQTSNNVDLRNIDTKLENIGQFSGFRKVGIRLPVIKNI